MSHYASPWPWSIVLHGRTPLVGMEYHANNDKTEVCTPGNHCHNTAFRNNWSIEDSVAHACRGTPTERISMSEEGERAFRRRARMRNRREAIEGALCVYPFANISSTKLYFLSDQWDGLLAYCTSPIQSYTFHFYMTAQTMASKKHQSNSVKMETSTIRCLWSWATFGKGTFGQQGK